MIYRLLLEVVRRMTMLVAQYRLQLPLMVAVSEFLITMGVIYIKQTALKGL